MRKADLNTKELIRLEAYTRLKSGFENYEPSTKEVDDYFNYLLDLWSKGLMIFPWENN